MFSPKNKGLMPSKEQLFIILMDQLIYTTRDILLTLELCAIRKYKLFTEI